MDNTPNGYRKILRRLTVFSLLAIGISLIACDFGKEVTVEMHSPNPVHDSAALFFLNDGRLYSEGDISRRWLDNRIVNLAGPTKLSLNKLDMDLHFSRLKNVLWSQLILDSMTYARLGIDDQDAMAFYSAHPDSFTFDGRWAEVIHLGFLHFEDADSALQQLNTYPNKLDSLLTGYNFDHQLVQLGHLPEVLDSIIFTLSLSKSFWGPVETDYGHHLLLIKKRYSSGNRIPFVFVRDKLIQTLVQASYNSTKSLILDSLYKDYYDRL